MYDLDFLLSSEAKSGRLVRANAYETGDLDVDRLTHVVHVEDANGDGFLELDAESYTHAMALAQSVVDTWSNIASAAIRKVGNFGELSDPIRIMDFRDAKRRIAGDFEGAS